MRHSIHCYTRYVYKASSCYIMLHMAFPIGFRKRSHFPYSANTRRQQRLWVICCSFCYLLVLWIQSSTRAIHTKNFPEPSIQCLQNKSMTTFPLCRKKVICNSSHKARNKSQFTAPADKYLMDEWFSVVFARFGITKNVSAFQGTYGKIAV